MLEPDFVALLKSWPGLADRELRRITKTNCNEWARALCKVASPPRYSNTLAGLRHVFEVAKDVGVVYRNPVEKLRAKQLTTLPSGDQFLQLVDAVEHAGAWSSGDCADFLRGLAFTGCRKDEASQIIWRDVDL
jgi:integrase